MTLQQVNLGTPPAGSDGDDPRTAFTRINSNFKQLDDAGLTGPIAAAREVANLNDASSPGKWIGTAAAANRPAGFTRSSIDVVEEVSGDLMQQATDKSTGRVANRVYTASTDLWSAWVAIGSGGAPGEPLPIEAGGTGGSTAEQARTNLGLKSLATLDKAPIDQGGTGGATAAEARHNLGLDAAAASFTGATAAAPGAPGLVPAPAAGDQDNVLRGDGTWGTPQSGGAGRSFGELVPLPSRNSSPGGVVKADGQEITNAAAQYPEAVADVQSATPSVPVVSAATWLADKFSRAAWAYSSATDTLYIPDWNGMRADSAGPLMFRGDGTLGFAPGKIRMDQIQNIKGSAEQTGIVGFTSTGEFTGAFKKSAKDYTYLPNSGAFASKGLEFDASGSVRTGTETFGKHGVGVWGVVLFGAVSNPGAADATALATSYANQQAALSNHEGRITSLEGHRHACTIVFDGTAATPVILSQKGRFTASSVTKTSAGQYVVNFPAALASSVDRIAVIGGTHNSASAVYFVSHNYSASTATAISVRNYAWGTAAVTDSAKVQLSIYVND